MQFAQRGVWGGWKPHKYWVFPHYTWGYIVQSLYMVLFWCVPSLYVRVYRIAVYAIAVSGCSLTIREGISEEGWMTKGRASFPHYTWGYIGRSDGNPMGRRVPSLYVRVYRKISTFQRIKTGSLTIREGISPYNLENNSSEMFPHYTWGYIVCFHTVKAVYIVPSLYVRVYHGGENMIERNVRSLTIREGISLSWLWT